MNQNTKAVPWIVAASRMETGTNKIQTIAAYVEPNDMRGRPLLRKLPTSRLTLLVSGFTEQVQYDRLAYKTGVNSARLFGYQAIALWPELDTAAGELCSELWREEPKTCTMRLYSNARNATSAAGAGAYPSALKVYTGEPESQRIKTFLHEILRQIQDKLAKEVN